MHGPGFEERQTADRRYEAIIVVTDTPSALAAAARAVSTLRERGVAVAVVTALDVDEVTSLLPASGDHAAPLLVSAHRGRHRSLMDGAALSAAEDPAASPAAPEDASVLAHFTERLAERLRVRGFAATVTGEGAIDLESGAPPPEDLADLAAASAADVGFEDPHVSQDGARIAIEDAGVRAGLRWVFDALWSRGVAPADVLVIDAADGVVEALEAQRRLFDAGALPTVDPAPEWRMAIDGVDPQLARVQDTLLSLADGVVGFPGALCAGPGPGPSVVVTGVYQGRGPTTHLLTAPVATRLHRDGAGPPTDVRRVLDLRSGILAEHVTTAAGTVSSIRFASLARPGTVALRVERAAPAATTPLLPPADDEPLDVGRDGETWWMRVASTEGGTGGIAAAAVERDVPSTGGCTLDRVAWYVGDACQVPDAARAVAAAGEHAAVGFDCLLAEHRRAWAARWADADIVVEGDEDLQRDTRFNLFHVMSAVPDRGEAAVGARGLTGPGYRGHVFWDSDTFVLPFLAATHPASARAMLEYRLRRLPAAIGAARALGRAGARFPWESAHTGEDVTPLSARDRTGRIVPIRTGNLEEHIVAQVALAAATYTEWTGDEEFWSGHGRGLLIETARYWASRVRLERDGTAHIYGVIGPDEYHEPVDDNAFTNVIARWNLRRAAEVVEESSGIRNVPSDEVARWRQLADALVDGFDADTGIYEQFAGFHELEPLIIAEVAPRRPIAADLLLGAERVRAAQIVKQADVLMVHHLLPDEAAPGSLGPNLRYYEPRTAHGSSLSPAIHAAVFARARDFEAALDALRIATRIDLDDLTQTTAGGLHLATMGGVWQAFAYGFMGLRPRGGRLAVDPRIPKAWTALEMNVRFHGTHVTVRAERGALHIRADAPVPVVVGTSPLTAGPGPDALDLVRRGVNWESAR